MYAGPTVTITVVMPSHQGEMAACVSGGAGGGAGESRCGMGSGVEFLVVLVLVVYLGPAAWLCHKVVRNSSRGVGRLMTAGLLGIPAALICAGLFVR